MGIVAILSLNSICYNCNRDINEKPYSVMDAIFAWLHGTHIACPSYIMKKI